VDEVADRVAGLLLDDPPELVVTFGPDGLTRHRYHVQPGEIGTEAFHRARRRGPPSAFRRLYHVVQRRSAMDAYYGAARRRGLPMGGPDTMMNPVGVPDASIAVDVDVIPVYGRKLAAIRRHRSQIDELDRIPSDLQPLHLAHECFVQAWPEPAGSGHVRSDLFADLAPAATDLGMIG